MQAGTRFVQIRSRRFGDHLYRVTRVIGGRTREDFAGVEVTGTQPDARIIGDAHDEVILPASYFFETASFRLKGYSVMVRERPGLKAGAVWNQSCVLCHNTAPTFCRCGEPCWERARRPTRASWWTRFCPKAGAGDCK